MLLIFIVFVYLIHLHTICLLFIFHKRNLSPVDSLRCSCDCNIRNVLVSAHFACCTLERCERFHRNYISIAILLWGAHQDERKYILYSLAQTKPKRAHPCNMHVVRIFNSIECRIEIMDMFTPAKPNQAYPRYERFYCNAMGTANQLCISLHKQESPPAWTQETYRPPCSKVPTPPSWHGWGGGGG